MCEWASEQELLYFIQVLFFYPLCDIVDIECISRPAHGVFGRSTTFFSGCFLLVDLNDYNIHIFAEMSLTFNRKKKCWTQIHTLFIFHHLSTRFGISRSLCEHHVCGHSKRCGFFPAPLRQINVEITAAATAAFVAVVIVVIFVELKPFHSRFSLLCVDYLFISYNTGIV